MEKRRAVITGVGPVSALGVGKSAFFAGLRENESPVAPVSSFSTEKFHSKLAAEVTGFDVEDFLESQKAYLDRASEYAYAAMGLALEDADMDMGGIDPDRTGIVLGSAYGNVGTARLFYDDLLTKGPRLVKPFLFPHTYSNTTISLLALEYGLRGPHLNFCSGGVAGLHAIIAAWNEILRGSAEIVFAGGFEALNELIFSGCAYSGLLSPADNAEEYCAPFDAKRNGTVLGEGACILVVEEKEHARQRGAHIYAEISSSALAGSAGGHRGMTRVLNAVKASQRDACSVLDWVCVNANGSKELDNQEATAVMESFSEIESDVPVSSILPLTGEALGATGAFQCAAVLGAMENAYVPFTVNLSEPEVGMELNLVRKSGIETHVGRALVLTADPGGSVGAVSLETCK